MIDVNKCCGCEACKNICPVNAIMIVKNEEGADISQICERQCINCGLCEQVCPLSKSNVCGKDLPEVYAAQINDREKCQQASSGGMGPAIYDYFIAHGGIVYGSAFTEDFDVQHIRCKNEKDIAQIVGSKYTQSKMGDIYCHIETDIKDGRQVCFIGTPCQNQALKNFLQSRRVAITNLFCIDFICHGVPSPMVWKDYIQGLKKEKNQEIRSVKFRNKSKGWSTPDLKIEFPDTIYTKFLGEEPYYNCFIKNYTLRESCYHCPFTSLYRSSDITIGDFWGAEERFSEVIETELGVSLAMINTPKGKLLWENIKHNCWNERVDFNMFYQRSLHLPALRPAKREKFWNEYLHAEKKIEVVRKYGKVNKTFYRLKTKMVAFVKKIKVYQYCVALATKR